MGGGVGVDDEIDKIFGLGRCRPNVNVLLLDCRKGSMGVDGGAGGCLRAPELMCEVIRVLYLWSRGRYKIFLLG